MPHVVTAALCVFVLAGTAVASERGVASYYGDGERLNPVTACGHAFSRWKIAAAHPSLPCGSRAKVINLANHREIIVTINDRGPHRRTGRIIDVTKRVAEILGFVKAGTARVLVVPLR